jgi:phosphonate transport system substrate-binding protein
MAGEVGAMAAGGGGLTDFGRRGVLGALAAAPFAWRHRPARAADPVTFALTPVVMTSDVEFLGAFEAHLTEALARPVALVQRRTYQEITALLLAGQIDAAWICGYPFVQYRDRLALVAVPLYRGEPLYQSYLIANRHLEAAGIDDLRGSVHAFSDPDSNSGYLVTRYLLSRIGALPETFFRRVFFTYGHRNVVRAVASGLAGSGSVDGYVWDVLAEIEPELVARTRIVNRSDRLGFPPVACLAARRDEPVVRDLRDALLAMPESVSGREILGMLRLDGFSDEPASLFDGIQALYDAVRSQS